MNPIVASLIAAIAATTLNLISAALQHRQPDAPYRLSWAARLFVGLFALLYAISLAWLLYGDIDQGDWSRRMIWLTPIAFITAWSIEPAGYLLRRHATRAAHNE